jgi:hypothetical protein
MTTGSDSPSSRKEREPGDSLEEGAEGCGGLVYLGVAVLNLLAIWDGLSAWLGWSSFFAKAFLLIPSMVVAAIPIAGTVCGIVSAIKVWGWSIPKTLLVFGSPLLVILFWLLVFVLSMLREGRKQ